jgi:sulfur carrier protein
MIQMNGRDHDWYEGMTIQSLITDLNYTYPILLIRVNGTFIEKENYGNTRVQKGDDVKIIHPIAGG